MSGASSELQVTLKQAHNARSLQDTSKALQLYQHALELLHAQIQAAAPASQQQQQLIDEFKDVLVKAEELKKAGLATAHPQLQHRAQQATSAAETGSGTVAPAAAAAAAAAAGLAAQQAAAAPTHAATVEPAAAAAASGEYHQRKEQARQLAVQAVAADGSGQVALALQLYSSLLDVLNRCHSLEGSAEVQAQIMARFQVYLERAELLRKLQGR
ncbi:hypothetical protein COO60DRAFT_369966 [Scenedesmus sp. NREL 46B-D3]|nr:hypothetical protein COO60DRAFT_369966 [Scenedesmus sp. NREL 46B-D3]